MAGIHDKHRQRVRQEFLARGFNENTPEHKMLEMLLFYSIPRKDTNELAHKLINRFGSLAGVLEADVLQLQSVEGVGENTAALLKLILPIAGACYRKDTSKKDKFKNMDDIYFYLMRKYYGLSKETFSILSFDSSGKLVGFDFLSSGDIVSVAISTRTVMEILLARKAVSAIIAHNHPKGNALPSHSDLETTKQLVTALRQVNITLADHLILCADDYVSLRQSSEYAYIFDEHNAF